MPLDDAIRSALLLATAHAGAPERTPGRSASLLTAREQAVAELIAGGLTNRQIGETLVITRATVDRHVSNILSKLGMATRSQVASWIAHQARN